LGFVFPNRESDGRKYDKTDVQNLKHHDIYLLDVLAIFDIKDITMFIHSVYLLYKDIKITEMAHNNKRDIPFFEWLPKSITKIILK
jgi:hypothetical protein